MDLYDNSYIYLFLCSDISHNARKPLITLDLSILLCREWYQKHRYLFRECQPSNHKMKSGFVSPLRPKCFNYPPSCVFLLIFTSRLTHIEKPPVLKTLAVQRRPKSPDRIRKASVGPVMPQLAVLIQHTPTSLSQCSGLCFSPTRPNNHIIVNHLTAQVCVEIREHMWPPKTQTYFLLRHLGYNTLSLLTPQ